MNKYITVLDFSNGRIYQYEVEERFEPSDENYYEMIIMEKGHKLNNCEWMVHDIKEFVDHTIRKLQ
tara:strand:- start:1 stop:198 length:198 start_codon:yes stop_codon:yes gene_type:complete